MKKLVLVGGGHAHLEILRKLIESPLQSIQTTLISTSRLHHYSGMVPGYLAGSYSEEDISFDLEKTCAQAGVRFLAHTICRIEPQHRQILTDQGRRIEFDLASFNLGSSAAGAERPEVSAAQLLKPISRAVQLRKRILQATANLERVRVVVVGAGAAGLEVACAARRRILGRNKQAVVHLVERTNQILSNYSRNFQQTGTKILANLGIQVHLEKSIQRVDPHQVVTSEGQYFPADITIWSTGASAPPLLSESGLAVDARGFLLVDDTLRSISNPFILAVGDCATLLNYPQTPKAGVYSVRQAPFLWNTIQASFTGEDAPRYQPQKGFLSILNTCDGKALLRYKRMISHSRWAWWLKDWIDRRFMARYQSLLD